LDTHKPVVYKSDTQLRLDAVFDTATDGIIIIDETGLMELVNTSAANLFGYAIEELIGKNVSTLMPSPHRGLHNGYLDNYLRTGERKIIGIGREVHGMRKDGILFPFRLSISEVILKDRRIFTGIIHDLTEQKHFEQALNEEKERAQNYLDIANTLIVVVNPEEQIELINEKGCEMLGYSEQQLNDKNWFDLCLEPETRDKYRSLFRNVMEERHEVPEYIENIIIVNGGHKRLIAFRNSLLRDKTGKPVAIISSGVDITEQRAAEERIKQLNAELEQRVEQRTEELASAVNQLLNINKKLETEIQERKVIEAALRQSEQELRGLYEKEKELSDLKSRFVAMASHEFRTPLSTILSSADLLDAYNSTEQHEKRLKHSARIKSAVSNLTSILNDFLSLSRLEEGKIQCQLVACDLSDFCQEILDEVGPLLKPGQTLDYNPPQNNTIIWIDKKILKNILYNLLSNAIKYSAEGQAIECRMSITEQELRITIRDYGIGIPEEEQQHLFTRFFRAHNVENIQGTGLGLNIVKRYLDLLDGNISFESATGKGSTFSIGIPLGERPEN
jgi:two-component system sensor kinase FixL